MRSRRHRKKRDYTGVLAAAIVVVTVLLLCAAAVLFFRSEDSAPAAASPETLAPLPEKQLKQVNMYEDDTLKCVREFRYNENGLLAEVKEHWLGQGNGSSEMTVTFAYDDAARVVESKTCFDGETEPFALEEYTYNDKGQLVSIRYGGAKGEGCVTYEYDEGRMPVRAVSEYPTGRTEFLYDQEGNIIRSTTWCGSAEPYTVEEIYRSEIICDGEYRPFTIKARKLIASGEAEAVYACLADSLGTEIYVFPFENPEFTADSDGYLVKARDADSGTNAVYTHLFYYAADAVPQETDEPSGQTQSPSRGGSGKLKYPISEEDCYIIYRNYFGYEMCADESMAVEVYHHGEGDEEYLMFAIYRLNENTGIYTMTGAFTVYVNTGLCRREITGEEFWAEDYYD